MKDQILSNSTNTRVTTGKKSNSLPQWEKPVLKVLSVTKDTLGQNTGTNFDNDTYDNTNS